MQTIKLFSYEKQFPTEKQFLAKEQFLAKAGHYQADHRQAGHCQADRNPKTIIPHSMLQVWLYSYEKRDR